jgi:hypothetical protein
MCDLLPEVSEIEVYHPSLRLDHNTSLLACLAAGTQSREVQECEKLLASVEEQELEDDGCYQTAVVDEMESMAIEIRLVWEIARR